MAVGVGWSWRAEIPVPPALHWSRCARILAIGLVPWLRDTGDLSKPTIWSRPSSYILVRVMGGGVDPPTGAHTSTRISVYQPTDLLRFLRATITQVEEAT